MAFQFTTLRHICGVINQIMKYIVIGKYLLTWRGDISSIDGDIWCCKWWTDRPRFELCILDTRRSFLRYAHAMPIGLLRRNVYLVQRLNGYICICMAICNIKWFVGIVICRNIEFNQLLYSQAIRTEIHFVVNFGREKLFFRCPFQWVK